ncbi:MAG: SDR family oxidoreductase [Gemmatimonadales bacterium]|nr:SDR family oxidoreductase [Gemmatimonadales bacterium]
MPKTTWPIRMSSRSSTAALAAVAGAAAVVAVRAARREEFKLRGRTVLVTGGSRGLGLALARETAAQGARVAICGRDLDALDRAESALARIAADVIAVECDVGDRAAVRAMIADVTRRLGPVDMLINNAGVIEVGPAETMKVEDYEEAMATNFWGILYPTLEVIPQMRERRSGRIVNITSIGGKLGIPHLLPYSASKFAAVGFSQGLRAELAGEGVKVVTVVPGLMRTGSPRNAIFRGRHRAEYAWFSIADSFPGLTVGAEEAARRIIAGARRGDAEVLFPLTARVAAVLNALAPDLTAGLVGLAGRLLPDPPAGDTGRRQGKESRSWLSPSWLTRLGDRAARRYNQMAPAEAP